MTGNRMWTIGIALAMVAVIALGWLFGISPMLAAADAASSQAQTVDSQNAAQQASTAGLKKQFAALPALKDTLATLEKAIPTDSDTEGILDELDVAARANGIVITAFTAGEPAPEGTAPAASGAPAGASTPAPDATATPTTPATPPTTPSGTAPSNTIYTVAISVSVTGTPQQVFEFVRATQAGDRFFLVTGVNFDQATPGGTVTGYVFVVRDPTTGPSASR